MLVPRRVQHFHAFDPNPLISRRNEEVLDRLRPVFVHLANVFNSLSLRNMVPMLVFPRSTWKIGDAWSGVQSIPIAALPALLGLPLGLLSLVPTNGDRSNDPLGPAIVLRSDANVVVPHAKICSRERRARLRPTGHGATPPTVAIR
jgi:hypothetical protein